MSDLHVTSEDMGVQQRVVRWMMITAVVAILVYLGFIYYANASDVRSALHRLSGWWILSVLLLSLMSYGVRALRWNYYLIRLGISMSHRLMLLLYFAGLSMLITPAMISGVVKVGLVKVRVGAELTKTLPIVVVERLTDLIGMLALAMFGILFFKLGYISIVGTVAFVIIAIAIIQITVLRNLVLDFFGLIPGLKHHIESVKKLLDSAQTLLDGEALIMGSFFGFISWGLAGLAMYVLIQGFNIELTLAETLFIMAFPAILGIMSQLPGGIGLEEGTMMSLLVRKDVALPEATALVLLFRLITLWFGLGIGLISLTAFTNHLAKEEAHAAAEKMQLGVPQEGDQSRIEDDNVDQIDEREDV
jgi:glycosyltransferase 2 family protein